MALYELSFEAAPGAIKRIVAVDSYTWSVDWLQWEFEGRQAAEDKELRVLHPGALLSYRRSGAARQALPAQAGTPHGDGL